MGVISDLYEVIPCRVIRNLNTKYNDRESIFCYPENEDQSTLKAEFDFEYYFLTWLIRTRADSDSFAVLDIIKHNTTPSKVYQFRIFDMMSAISRYKILNPYFKIYSKNHLKKVVHKWINCGVCHYQEDGTIIFTIFSFNKTHAKYAKPLANIYG